MEKIIRNLMIIVVISFLAPIAIVASTVVVNGTFTIQDFYDNIMFSWQLPVVTGVFWIGVPTYIWRQLQEIKKLVEHGKLQELIPYYKKVIFTYFTMGLLFSLTAAVIPGLIGYSTKVAVLAATISVLFIGTTNLPIYHVFVIYFDRLFEGVEFTRRSYLSVKFKLRVTAVFSAISGVGLLLVSSGILTWRLLYFPEWELTFEIMIYRLVGLSLFIIVLQMLPNIIIGNSVSRNIYQIGKYANSIAQKDLTASMTVNTRDEIGLAVQQFLNLGSTLREIIGQIRTNAQFLKNASTELNNLATNISESSNDQASSAQELAASMEEMSANISLSSENAVNSEEVSKASKNQIINGQQSMVTTLTNIKNITEKVDLVQKIAGQTNLLAVNASIEAASAGEHGKGFAVIAREVRDLADRSKASAVEITDLAVECLANSNDLKVKIEEVADGVAQNADMASNIANASKEQQNGSDQINATVQNLNNNAQHLASSAEELSASSQELLTKSNLLEQMVGTFNI